ncbi:MAG: phage tail assembly chaperone [bacterium]
MREPVRKDIDGEQYTFYQLAPKKSLKLLTRILKIIGGPIGTAIGKDGMSMKAESLFDLDIDLGAVVGHLCRNLDENEVEAIVDSLMSQVFVDGKGEVSKVFDEHFGGRLPHLFKVVFAALEVEYGSFFDGMLDRIKQRLAEAITRA